MSCVDLTLVSSSLASSCESAIGSDHFPISCSVVVDIDIQERTNVKKRSFAKADWEKFKKANQLTQSQWIEECE